MMNIKVLSVVLSTENSFGEHYYANLLLPAEDYEIKDAMQKVRAVGRESMVEFSVDECDILPELEDIRLGAFSLDELNFFAKRLASILNEELLVFYAVKSRCSTKRIKSRSVLRTLLTAPTAWTLFPSLIM